MIASGANQGKAAATPLLIGANYPGTTFARLNAEIYRIFIWNTPLNPVELLQVEIWLRDRYAQAYPWASAPAFTVFHGDSIMQGTAAGGTDGDINATAPYKAAQTLGLSLGQWMNLGIPGIQTRTMDSLAPSWVDPLPALLGKYVNLVAFEWYNEAVPFGDPTPYNDGVTYLANRKAASSKFRIAWGTSTDTSQGIVNNTRRSAYNSAWDSAHANVDSYISIHTDGNVGDTNAFTNHPTNFSGDGVHLSGTGYTALGTLLSNGVTALPMVYEIVGPSGGAHGVASSAFTVNLSKMSALNDTITLTASEGTITATAAGATITGNGTGTVQVQMPANMFTFTFTYTPGTAGAKTITPTNGQAWTDPAASNYTAS
jgi:hypothetical protein